MSMKQYKTKKENRIGVTLDYPFFTLVLRVFYLFHSNLGKEGHSEAFWIKLYI